MVDFLRGTDVLIMDTQYDAEEYQRPYRLGPRLPGRRGRAGHRGRGEDSSSSSTTTPTTTTPKSPECWPTPGKIVAARKGKLQVEAAREGVTVELPAEVEGVSAGGLRARGGSNAQSNHRSATSAS